MVALLLSDRPWLHPSCRYSLYAPLSRDPPDTPLVWLLSLKTRMRSYWSPVVAPIGIVLIPAHGPDQSCISARFAVVFSPLRRTSLKCSFSFRPRSDLFSPPPSRSVTLVVSLVGGLTCYFLPARPHELPRLVLIPPPAIFSSCSPSRSPLSQSLPSTCSSSAPSFLIRYAFFFPGLTVGTSRSALLRILSRFYPLGRPPAHAMLSDSFVTRTVVGSGRVARTPLSELFTPRPSTRSSTPGMCARNNSAYARYVTLLSQRSTTHASRVEIQI